MSGGTNQYSSMPSMQKAQRFAGQGKFGRAKQAWEQGGGDWTDQTHQGLQQLGGIGQGRTMQALRFGQGGDMGRAAQQIGRGGGQWGEGYSGQEDGVGGLLRGYLGTDPSTQDLGAFNYGDISDADLQQAQRFAGAGMMGRAKGMFGDAWSGDYGDRLQTQLASDAARNPYEQGTSMGFDWGGATPQQVIAAKQAAMAGTGGAGMGRAKQAFGAENWSPLMNQQMQAYRAANQ
tara:strand:+ start:419 stop:1117 length:699 start_codon:yes stop_codon:yes gene_type:complete